MDTSLATAVVKSLETGSLTPLIKEELKLKIQSSRLAAGKEELPKVVFKEPEKFPLSPEEERRRDVRRERNRVAALKCRKKKKSTLETAQKELTEQRSRRRKLEAMMDKLTKEKDHILQELAARNISVPKNLTSSESSPVDQEIKQEIATGQERPNSSVIPDEAFAVTNIPPISPSNIPPISPFEFIQYQTEPSDQPSFFSTSITPPPLLYSQYETAPREFDPLFSYLTPVCTPDTSFSRRPSSTLSYAESLATESPSPADIIPTTVFDFNSKEDSVFGIKEEGLVANTCNDVEAQVPGYLRADDDVISSQELLTLYD